MPCFSVCRLGCVLAFILSSWAVGGHAEKDHHEHEQEIRYRYVSLSQIELPTGFTLFLPLVLQDSGRVYGTLCQPGCGVTRFAYFEDGKLTVLPVVPPPHSFVEQVNARGTIGVDILVDPNNFIFRAAIVERGQFKFIPPQPGETSSFVPGLNDHDTALVESDSASGMTHVLYRDGKATPINFGPNITDPTFFGNPGKSINNNAIIAGTESPGLPNGTRGFRFDPRNGSATILNPFPGDPTETQAAGMAINQGGDVLGYSFTNGPSPYHERIGIWGRNGVFYTYFVENETSHLLLFNEDNLIVITKVASSTSYIVPRPGVRLNLANLVVNLPAGQDVSDITDLNNRGDMLGFSSHGARFLLQRLNEGDRQTYPTPVVNGARHVIPPELAIIRDRLHPSAGQLK